MNDVLKRVAALPPDKQAILLQQLRQKVSQPSNNQPPVQASHNEWVVRYRPNPQAHLRLFCLPYAGGGASLYRPWLEALPPDIELCGIQLPGRESRLGESAYTRLIPLVQTLAEALIPYLDKPFAFYGHSMGALISFELARQLRMAHNKHPVSLYLAAFRAPQLPNPNIKIHHLPTEMFKVVLRAEGIPELILQNNELMQAMLPTLRADFELCDSYEYREERPLACPFYIFGGMEDVRVSIADLELWPMHSSAQSHLTMLPGSHFFLHSAQDLLLTAIIQDLEGRLNTPVPTGLADIQTLSA
jgi:surfactin synthase thioesterase subunit